MDETADFVKGSLEKAYSLIKKNAQELFIEFLKVGVLSTTISMVGLLLTGAVLFIFLGASLAGYLANLADGSAPLPALSTEGILGMIVAAMVWLISALISSAIGSVAYNVVDASARRKQITSIREQFRKNIVPIIKLDLLKWGVIVILFLPIATSLAFGSIGTLIGLCILPILLLIAYIIFAFLIQFSMLELLLGGRGVLESIKSSASLVRANLLSVIVLDILLVVITIAASAGTKVIETLLQFIPSIFSLLGAWGMAAGYAIFFVMLIALYTLVFAATQTIILPIMYYFWKGLKE